MDTLAEKKRSLTARSRTWTAAAGTLAKKKKKEELRLERKETRKSNQGKARLP